MIINHSVKGCAYGKCKDNCNCICHEFVRCCPYCDNIILIKLHKTTIKEAASRKGRDKP